ncbi:MAG TPA: DUF5661 family protein [archaeon]|nr:DUF5661 family protein [archaeon]
MTAAKVSGDEAKIILHAVNVQGMNIPLEDFRQGLEVELEHGIRYDDANVTNNHPLLTGKIVLAHLKESMLYYKLLEVAEIEGDLIKAAAEGKASKLEALYKKFVAARLILNQAESKELA